MIVLKILLWILLAIIGLIVLVCIVPVGGEVSYIDGKLKYKIKLWLFNIMDSEGGGLLGRLKKRKKNKKPKPPAKRRYKAPKPKKSKKNKTEKIDIKEAEEPVSAESDVSEETAETELPTEKISEEGSDAEETEEKTPDKPKKKKSKNDSDEEYYTFDDEDEDEDDDEKSPLSKKLEKLINIWNSAKHPIRLIFKGFKFSEVYIDFIIADEDASKCAVKYGRYSGIIYNAVRVFGDLFTLRFKTVDIQPGFGISKAQWDASAKLNFRLGTVVIAGIWFLITYIFRIVIPNKLKARKQRKHSAKQK